VVMDETAGPNGLQEPLQRPLRKRMRVQEEEEEEDEDEDKDAEEEEPGGAQKLNRIKNKDRTWVNHQPRLFGLCVPDFLEQPLPTVPDEGKTPFDFYKLFLSDEFVDKMVTASRMYAMRKGRADIQSKITNNSLRTSIAIMHMTGYLTPANRLMYWQQ
jgi:hypothetical protein